MVVPFHKVGSSEVSSFSFNPILQKIYFAITAAQLPFLSNLLPV